MGLSTFIVLWMFVFHKFFFPEDQSDQITPNNFTELTTTTNGPGPGPGIVTIPPFNAEISIDPEPTKPPFDSTDLIIGGGGGGYDGPPESESATESGGTNCGTLVLNQDTSIYSTPKPGGYQQEIIYKRWECLWPETQCQMAPAIWYCSKGCLTKYSTISHRCFDGCCRCLIFTSEGPTESNQDHYVF